MSGYIYDTKPSKLGGGVAGGQPRLLGGKYGMIGSSERSRFRFIQRNMSSPLAMLVNKKVIAENYKTGLTPFRQYTNSGDLTLSVNSGPHRLLPQTGQINGIKASMLRAKGDSVLAGQAAFSGNPKYVYDSSDYIRFKTLTATVKTYNDKSFGGANNGAYSFIMHVRH